MKNPHLDSELQITNITSSKAFKALGFKTQVAFSLPGMSSIISTRLTHSYEAANSASIIAFNMERLNGWAPYTIDYQGSLRPCTLAHDIGHPPLAHCGSELMDSYFKAKGVPEGFCDNNNTLSVIEKNDIVLSAHTIASVIKYPERLYPYQKEKYTALLQKELDIDRAHFSSLQISSRRGAVRNFKLKKQTRTIACEIMDIADRNTYITSDLSDFICLGNSIPANDVKALAENVDLKCRFSHLAPLIFVLQSNDKKVVNNYFNNLKNEFNMNYKLTENGVEVINKDLEDFREFLWKLEFQYYISPLRKEEFHLNNMKSFTAFIDKVVIDGFSPSRTYTKAIASATNPIETLRAQRDMIAEATDWYVTKMQGTENGSLSY